MTHPPEDMAQFGATVYAMLTFAERWDGDMLQALGEAADRHRLPTDNKSHARRICEAYGLRSADLGDEIPELDFDSTEPRPSRDDVRDAFEQLQDATEEDWYQAPDTLIDVLFRFAAIRQHPTQ